MKQDKIRIQKGNCILVDGWWFVIVNIYYQGAKIYFNCICDNANNRYTHELHEISETFDTKDIGYKDPKSNRKLPYKVIAEVLAGQHDDRFDDYWNSSET